jgi:MoaA/NifB/PqqE/SkfB family radical SAM enzyme
MGIDQVSFLAADVSSQAFNRAEPWTSEKKDDVALNLDEIKEWEKILRGSFDIFKREYQAGFIAESQQKLMDIGAYYRAMRGQGKFPTKKCNAPWVSAVIESTGDVLPCFFHKPYGNANSGRLEEIINSQAARSFRRQLDTDKDPICQRCVCSLHVGVTQFV